MSRLIEKLTRQRQPEVQPMGFMLSRAKAEKIQMLVIAEVEAENWEKMAAGLKAADAALIDVTKADDLALAEKNCQDKEAVPSGGWLKSTAAAVTKKAANSECDFIAFSTTAPVAMTRKEKLGRILEVDLNWTDGLLRAAGDLPVDAVLVSGKTSELVLNVNRLLYIQRLLNVVNKPLLLAIPDNISALELQALWDMGVAGVLIEVNDDNSLRGLTELRTLADKLEVPAFRKKGKTMAILPKAALESAAPPSHEEEEEDE
jgi:hypothetical protein